LSLISEALRSEDVILRVGDGAPFVKRCRPAIELARDVVARAMGAEIEGGGRDRVYLDVSRNPAEVRSERF